MASAGYKLTITAVDNTTAAFDKINQRIIAQQKRWAMTRAPIDNLANSVSKFAELTGISKVGKGLSNVARESVSAFRGLAQVLEPLGIITGAATLAGMYKLVSSWGQFGTTLLNTGARLGINTDKLQGLENAARLAGSSAGAMEGTLQNLGDLAQDALAGRNPQALRMFQYLGMDIRKSGIEAKSGTELLGQAFDVIKNFKGSASSRLRLMDQLGIDRSMLRFALQGADGLKKYNAEAQKYGLLNQKGAEQADQLREAQTKVQLAFEGLGYSIAEKVGPALTPLLTQFADWIATSPEVKAGVTALGQGVKDLGEWIKTVDWKTAWITLKDDISAIGTKVQEVVGFLGGWKQAGEIVLGFFVGKFLLGMLAPIAQIAAALLSIPGKAAVATQQANMQLNKIGIGNKFLNMLGTGAGIGILMDILSGKTGEMGNARLQDPKFLSENPQFIANEFDAARADAVPHPQRSFFNGGLGRMLTGEPNGDAPVASRPADKIAAAKQVYDRLLQDGRTPDQAAGMVARMDLESGFSTNTPGDGGLAYGALQWHPDRQANFAAWAGHDIRHSNLQEQTDFANFEITQGKEQAGGKALQQAQNAREAGAVYSRMVIRPGLTPEAKSAEAHRTANLAEYYANLFNGKPAPTAKDTTSNVDLSSIQLANRAATPAVEAAPAKPADISGNVRIDLFHNNPPPGTTMRAQSNGDYLGGVNYSTSMPAFPMP